MREIVLDTETTGFNARGGDRIVEIGCVEIENLVPTGEIYHVYINPERSMPASAENVHGLGDEFLADKAKFAEIAEDFLQFIGQDPLIIHNAPFDIGFLDAELERAGFEPITLTRSVDTVRLARKRFPGLPNKLDDLIKRFNIDGSKRVKHGALLDAELLAEVYLELKGGRQSSMMLADDSQEIKEAVVQAGTHPERAKPLAARITSAERTAHRKFVETLGDGAHWLKSIDLDAPDQPPKTTRARKKS